MKDSPELKGDSVPEGVWPVMITPFTGTAAIDWYGLDAVVEWYIQAGVAGLFAVCLSSEMYELTPDERIKLAEHVVRRAEGRVPVIAAGAFGDSCESQAESAKRIAGVGVSAVVLTVNQLAAEDEPDSKWQNNTEAVCNACSDIPLGLYECPLPYHRLLSPQMLGWAARSGRFLFLKDTCCRLASISAKLDAIRGTTLRWFNAHEPTLLESLRAGGQGYSGIAANFYPELFVRLCADFADNPLEADRLQQFLTLADMTIRHRYPASAKQYLGILGLPVGEVCRLPVPASDSDDEEMILLNLRKAVADVAMMRD